MDAKHICPSCQKPLAPDVPMGLCPECLLKAGLPSAAGTETGPAPRAFVPPSAEELANRFPQLEILELIGQGGMGAVYKARQTKLNRIVALKILPPAVSNKPAFAERFTREAQALARLNHPGIVTLYEFGETTGLFYFLMEYVDGVTLRQLLQNGRVSTREALAIVPQICDALQYAHDQGIVHRDIKPENILLDRRGRVKVADFGLARIIGNQSQLEALGGETLKPADQTKVMGTPQYMSPEQISAPGEVDHRADIYALGVVFYQMLTGELPERNIEPPSKKVQIDVRLDEVVLRALEKNPELRYQQASVFKTQVETIATTIDAGNPPGAPSNAPFTKNEHRLKLYISCLIAVLPILCIWVFSYVQVVPRLKEYSLHYPDNYRPFPGISQTGFLDFLTRNWTPKVCVGSLVLIAIAELLIPGWRRHRRAFTWSVVLLVNVITVITLIGMCLLSIQGAPAKITPYSDHATNGFGPSIKRMLAGAGDASVRFIDFESGHVFTASEFFGTNAEPSQEETLKWRRSTGIDACGDTSPAVRGLVGFEMVAISVPEKVWEDANLKDLDYYLADSSPGTPVVMSGKGKLPATFVIKTAQGNRGILQILGFTDKWANVELRYRMEQKGTTPATPVQ